MKPLKDTKVGEWLKNNAPQILDTVGAFMPAPIKGTMNVVKDLVSSIPGITHNKVTEFNTIADEHEMEIIQLHNEEMANARASNIQIQTSAVVPGIVKLRPTILAFFVAIIWGSMTTYIICALLNIVSKGDRNNFDSILALYSGLNLLMGTILNFDFGSSAGSKAKQETIDSIAKS